MRAHSAMYSRASSRLVNACPPILLPHPQRTECTQKCLDSSWPILDLSGKIVSSQRPSMNCTPEFKYASLTLVPLAICTTLVTFQLQQCFDCLLILGCSFRSRVCRRSSRHHALNRGLGNCNKFAFFNFESRNNVCLKH